MNSASFPILDPSTAAGEPALFRVLIVDDEALNRRVVAEVLTANHFDCALAQSGQEAIEMAADGSFDAILLDVIMPGMTGYETCAQLKANPATEAVPVLLLTALADRDMRLEGIAAGANDFLTKPFDVQDLPLRIRNACRMHQLHRAAEDNLRQLRHLEQLRDDLTHMIVHDMRSPLLGISGHLELLKMEADSFTEPQREAIDSAAGEAAHLVEMVNSLLDISRLEEQNMPLRHGACDLSECAFAAVRGIGARARAIRIEIAVRHGQVVFDSDLSVTTRIVLNFLDNAIKAGATHVTISGGPAPDGSALRATITDNGPSIPKADRERIFDKFCQVECRRKPDRRSSGIGLNFCKLAAEGHGGTVGVAESSPEGTTIFFELPAYQQRCSASVVLPA